MYVPGMDERKITKLANLSVDTAVLDLEDGVAVNQKVYHLIRGACTALISGNYHIYTSDGIYVSRYSPPLS